MTTYEHAVPQVAAAALRHCVERVDCVDIDPTICWLGRQFHPDHVYDDPRVTLTVNDGRAFLRSTTERYDLIVFAFPDSLTLVNASGNLRLESFLFTLQSFGSVRDHLASDSAESRRGNDAPDRVTIALNTVLSCGTALAGESIRTLPPLGCSISDNLLVGDSGKTLVSMPYQQGITWAGNILWGQASNGNISGGYSRKDPLLTTGGVRRLTSGSPAINAGDPGVPGSGGSTCEATDQRGVTRPIGTRCDIGAFESGCGDGVTDPGEECDDGNAIDSDGCQHNCTLSGCGNGVPRQRPPVGLGRH